MFSKMKISNRVFVIARIAMIASIADIATIAGLIGMICFSILAILAITRARLPISLELPRPPHLL